MWPGVTTCLIGGQTVKGPAGGFTNFAPGSDAGIHSHTNDVLLVVLNGAYLYKDDAGEKRVGAGDFLRIPGGHKHWSGGDAKEGALFYQETFGKFDLIPGKLGVRKERGDEGRQIRRCYRGGRLFVPRC